MKAIILAAGYSTRLYPLTLNKPKALLEINGTFIIDYILNQINKIKEINEIIVVTNNKFYKDFYNWALKKKQENLKILNDKTNSNDTKKGAIGDIQFTIETENIKEDTLIVASDNLFTFNLKDYYKFYKLHNKDCICVKEINDIELLKRFGVASLNKNNIIIDFEEKPKEPKSNIGVYGIYIYKNDTLQLIKKYLNNEKENDAPGYFLKWIYKKKDILAYKFKGECYDIGTMEFYKKIKNCFEK